MVGQATPRQAVSRFLLAEHRIWSDSDMPRLIGRNQHKRSVWRMGQAPHLLPQGL